MSKISNYILTENGKRNYWKIPQIGEKYSVTGICNGEDFCHDNALIVKSGIIKIEGEEFKLLNKDKDYEAFCCAQRKGIPIIEMWNIKGSEQRGYYITGHSNSQLVKVKVAMQIGNYIISDKGIEYYVLWKMYSPEFEERMFECAIAADDIKFPEKFDWVAGTRCRPRIPVVK